MHRFSASLLFCAITIACDDAVQDTVGDTASSERPVLVEAFDPGVGVRTMYATNQHLYVGHEAQVTAFTADELIADHHYDEPDSTVLSLSEAWDGHDRFLLVGSHGAAGSQVFGAYCMRTHELMVELPLTVNNVEAMAADEVETYATCSNRLCRLTNWGWIDEGQIGAMTSGSYTAIATWQRRVFAGSSVGRIYEVAFDGEVLVEQEAFGAPVRGMLFHDDQLVVASRDGVAIYNPDDLTAPVQLLDKAAATVTTWGSWVVVATEDGELSIYEDLAEAPVFSEIIHDDGIVALASNHDHLFAAGVAGHIAVVGFVSGS